MRKGATARKVHFREGEQTRCGIKMAGEIVANVAPAIFVSATTALEAVTCARCLSPNRGGPLAGSVILADGRWPLRR